MYSAGVTHLNNTSGTFSSGASPTNYEPQWANQGNQRVDGPIEIFSLPITDSGTTGGNEQNQVSTLYWREQTRANLDPLLLTEETFRVRTFHLKIHQQLDAIRQRKDDWDGYASKRPNSLSLTYAKQLLDELLLSVIAASRSWIAPFITSDEDGHVTAEWYNGERELHIIVREHKAVYIKVWGTNIENEMHVDILGTEDYLEVWDWLLDGQ